MSTPKRVNLIANEFRPDAIQATLKAAKWLLRSGYEVGVDEDTGKLVDLEVIAEDVFERADLVVAFGGDGTLIRAAHLCSRSGTPILGVYYGRFGFVTQCTADEIESCVNAFFVGEATVESRMMISADLLRGGQNVATIHALNEIVLQRSANNRMMIFDVSVDGHKLTSYPADGVLVSTPTGSTAYNLSAGGPILDPTSRALVLTALAPHTLTARALVLRHDREIRLWVQSRGDALLSADGQSRLHILSGDEVLVRCSPRLTNLVTVERDDFLIKLGQRLFWSQSMFGAEE